MQIQKTFRYGLLFLAIATHQAHARDAKQSIGSSGAQQFIATQSVKPESRLDLFRWELLSQWPIGFPDLEAAKRWYGADNFYPQDFTVDEHRGLAFINYGPNKDPNALGQLVVVRRWPEGQYVSSFAVGKSAGWLWVEHQRGRTLLVKRLGGRGMGKWDISELPPNLTLVDPAERYDGKLTDAFVYGTYRDGVATINGFSDTSGNKRQLTFFRKFDENFTGRGAVRFSRDQMGSLGPDGKDLPHVQGFQDAGEYYFLTVGAIYKPPGPSTAGQAMGIRTINKAGQTISEGLMMPDRFLDVLKRQGIMSNRIEGEGAWVSKNGTPYSLWVNLWNLPGTDQSGLLVFRHFSGSGIDFSDAALPK